MTNISSTGNGYGVLNTLIANSASIHQQLDALTEQASTGKVSQTYAGLGAGAATSLNLNPQMNALQTYQKNIDQASGPMEVTQSAMTQLQQIASTFVGAMPNLNNLNPSEVDSVAANARSALIQVASLLDTRIGNVYVFAGQDSSNPPVPSPESILSSGFFTQINGAVSSMPANGVAATVAATLATGASNTSGTSPFSAYMSQPATSISAPVVQTGETTSTQTGLLASANSTATSSGSSTTGSYMRDLMRALATLGSMSSSQVNDPGFGALVQDTGASLNGAVSAMATDVGAFGNSQADLTATKTQLASISTVLAGQVNTAEEVDMATTLSNLTSMQTQLQASYRLISSATSMSLVNFLPAGA